MSADRDPPAPAGADPAERRDGEPALAALRELVRLKDLKDRDGETEDYRRNKDRAWAEARRVIADRRSPS